MLTSKTGVRHKRFIIFVYDAAQQQSKKLRKQEAGPKGFAEDRAGKWLKQDSEKESRRRKKKIQWYFLKRNTKRAEVLQKRWKERSGATETAPAGAVCWEQVVYLGQHIASSAFPPTCLSKQGRKGANLLDELHY